MRIGDEVYIHGYVDEIRKDTVIIRNDGGYFGTVEREVVYDPPDAWDDGYADGRSDALNDVQIIIEKANDENRSHVGVVQNNDMDKAYSIIWERVNELMEDEKG